MTSRHLETLPHQSWPKVVIGLLKAVYTVFSTPTTLGHDENIYLEVAAQLRDIAQSTQPTLTYELARISGEALQHTDTTALQPRLATRELLGLAGILMQFTSYLPQLRAYCYTPFEDTEKLYKAFTAHRQKAPLDFSRQLTIALAQSSGDLPEALWRLFITSRLYARWFDESVITDMPSFSRDEIIQRMVTWSRAIAACKAYGSCTDQDTSGDVYYCWTHALGKVVYTSLAAKQTVLTRLEARALHSGTRLNHGLAHRFKPQRLPSDHTIAAAYGNAIGEACVAHVTL